MIFMIVLTALIAAIWLTTLWLRGGEDLSRYQRPVEPSAFRNFADKEGPSEAHQKEVQRIVDMGQQRTGKTRRELVQHIRELMEEIPHGREFNCEFRPVTVSRMAGEWILAPESDFSRRLLYLHGGGFIAGSPQSHRTITSRLAAQAGAAVLAVDYRLMPEHSRLAGIEDCHEAYRWIIENGPDGPLPAKKLFISGDSAGGNLALMLAPWIRDERLQPPSAIVALSPVTDSTYSGKSLRDNAPTDVMLGPLFAPLMKLPRWVLNWLFVLESRMRPANPLVSPIFADLSGLPPILVQVSGSEILLDDAIRYVNKARDSGSPAQLQRWEGLLHVWQIFAPELPEANQAFENIGEFIRSVEIEAPSTP